MSKNISSVIKEILLSSTSHGIPNIIRSDKLGLRLIWIISTIISTGLCSYMIVQGFINYFSFETTSKIQVYTETSSIFPAITICNLNYFTTEYSVEFIRNLSLDIPQPSSYFDYDKYFMIRQIISTNEELMSNSYEYGDSFEKLIIYCQLLTIDCKNKEYWNYFYHEFYGNCYQINTKLENLIRVSRTGWSNALHMILNISVAYGLEDLFPSIGAAIMIHNQTTSPLSTDAFAVSPGVETSIAISRQFRSSVPKPYSNCDGDTSDPNAFDTKLFKLINSKNISYNQQLCVDLCFQDMVIKECKCYYIGFPFLSDKSIKPCKNDSEYECIYSKIENDFNDSSIVNTVCQPQCPLECESMSYKILYSYNDFLNKKNNEDLNDFYNFTGTNRRQMKKDLLSLYFYYETLNYEKITEKERIDFVDLLSNIGGIAGLFLGISFLSLVEIIEIVFQVLDSYIHRTKVIVLA
ncbi:unnamed protein product [Brachionus calyciflorus]|uniref:Uncharacterized protein n=1 Tax=Brachionus calyciflorus TaxID=104777 RepID=A0A814C430_9BILA|nr:unnamed protein product [Brachionus calyciflorus]